MTFKTPRFLSAISILFFSFWRSKCGYWIIHIGHKGLVYALKLQRKYLWNFKHFSELILFKFSYGLNKKTFDFFVLLTNVKAENKTGSRAAHITEVRFCLKALKKVAMRFKLVFRKLRFKIAGWTQSEIFDRLTGLAWSYQPKYSENSLNSCQIFRLQKLLTNIID
jgi:hypothetical protein